MKPKFKVGDIVEVTSHYQWCGDDVYGTVGTVIAVHDYTAHNIPIIYSIRAAVTTIPMYEDELKNHE